MMNPDPSTPGPDKGISYPGAYNNPPQAGMYPNPPQAGAYPNPPLTAPYPAPPASAYAPAALGPTRRTIRHISVGSAMKVGAVVSALTWAVVGLLFGLISICGAGLMGAVFGALTRSYSYGTTNSGNGGGFLAGGLIGFLLIYILGFVFQAIAGGLVGALYAWAYNRTASWFGGLEIEVA